MQWTTGPKGPLGGGRLRRYRPQTKVDRDRQRIARREPASPLDVFPRVDCSASQDRDAIAGARGALASELCVERGNVYRRHFESLLRGSPETHLPTVGSKRQEA